MDTNITVLTDATGCSEAEAEAVLKITEGDVTKSLHLLESMMKRVIIFQVKAESPDEKIFMVLKIDAEKPELIRYDFLYTEVGFDIGIDLPPDDFLNVLEEKKKKTTRDKIERLNELKMMVSSSISDDFIKKIYILHNQNEINKVIEELGDLIRNVIGKNMKVSYHTHEIKEKIEAGGLNEEPFQTNGKGYIELECSPVINPTDGVLVKELKNGDEILVKIEDKRELGIYIAELVGGKKDDEVLPLLVPVVSLEEVKDNELSVKVEIGPGIYGKFVVPSEVKIANENDVDEFVNPLLDEADFWGQQKFYKHILYALFFLYFLLIALLFLFIYYD